MPTAGEPAAREGSSFSDYAASGSSEASPTSVRRAARGAHWLGGLDKVRKRYHIAAAAHNLGIVMRKLFGIGTLRAPQVFVDLALALYLVLRLRPRNLAYTPEPIAPKLLPAAA